MTTGTGANMREARRQRLVRRLAPDRANAIAWALVLAWGAVVLLLDINGVSYGNGWDGGAVFGVGAGTALLGIAFMQALGQGSRRGMAFKFVVGGVVLFAGLGGPFDFDGRYVAVAALVLIAGLILLRSFRRAA